MNTIITTTNNNKYRDFEYTLFAEVFLLLREMCTSRIQSYRSHLMWHGIDICTEIFDRKVNCKLGRVFRQPRQLLLAWIVHIINKVTTDDYDYVAGLCDTRCYKMSEINVDENLFDDTSTGPQIPPPSRLRLQQKRSLKKELEDELLKPTAPSLIPYTQKQKKPFKEGKLTAQNVILEERWKRFDDLKEIKYIKIFFDVLIGDRRFEQYKNALESCRDLLQYRHERTMSFVKTDEHIIRALTPCSRIVTQLMSMVYIRKTNENDDVPPKPYADFEINKTQRL